MNETTRVAATEVDTATMPTLDVRKHARGEQIRGAVRYDPKALLGEERLALPLAHDRRIVVYAEDDDDAARIAGRLRDQGYAKAAVLAGGLEAWKAAGLPTEALTQEQPVPGNSEAGIEDV